MYHIISYELFYTWVHMLKCVIITLERWDEAPPCKFKLMSELMMLHAHQEIMKRLLTYYNFLRRTGPALKQHWKCLREPGRSVGFGSCCSYRVGLTWIPIKQRVCVCVVGLSVMSSSLWSHGLRPTRVLWPWDFTCKNTSGLPSPTPGSIPDLGF